MAECPRQPCRKMLKDEPPHPKALRLWQENSCLRATEAGVMMRQVNLLHSEKQALASMWKDAPP